MLRVNLEQRVCRLAVNGCVLLHIEWKKRWSWPPIPGFGRNLQKEI